MGAAFDPPPGDAGGMSNAAATLGHVSSDLQADATKVKNGVQTATSDWRATRRDDFEAAVFGMQVQLTTAMEAAGTVSGILRQYSLAITAAAAEVTAERRKAARAQTDLDSKNTHASAGGGSFTTLLDHMIDDGTIALAQTNAEAAKARLATLASRLAAAIDEQTAKVAPSSSSLYPEPSAPPG